MDVAKKHAERLNTGQIEKLVGKNLIVKYGEEWLTTGDTPSTKQVTVPHSDPHSDSHSDPQSGSQSDPQYDSRISLQVKTLLKVMGNGEYSVAELMEIVGLKHKSHFRKFYLNPAIELGLVVMSHPEQRNHRNQRYKKA